MDGYSIDEAAARTGLSKHTLRYYAREGLLPAVKKGASGHRRYSDDDLGWVRMLQLLRSTGMPIREVKEFVRLTWSGDHTIPERIAVLAEYREALVERMARDVEHLAALNHKIEYYEGVVAAREATPEDVIAASRPQRR